VQPSVYVFFYIFQFTIDSSLIARCSKTNAQKFVNDLMIGLFGPQFLATHSLTGVKSSKGGAAKEAIPDIKIKALIGKLQVLLL
jgi:hypothetical protein